MAKALSIDVREKIVNAYYRNQGTISELANIFNVCTRVIDKLLSLDRRTGDLTPGKSTGRPLKITVEHHAFLKKIIKENPDKTLQEYCNVFSEHTGIFVGTSIMDRAFKKLNIRRKKKSYYAAEQDRPDVKKKEKILSRQWKK